MGSACTSESTVAEMDDANMERATNQIAPAQTDKRIGQAIDSLSYMIWGYPKKTARAFFQKRKVNEIWVKAFVVLCLQTGAEENLTDSQRDYITTKYSDVDPSIVDQLESDNATVDDLHSLTKSLHKLYKNPSITIFPEYESFRDCTDEYLLYLFLCGTARGGFAAMSDSNIAYEASELVGVDRQRTDFILDLLERERELFECMDGVFTKNESLDDPESKRELDDIGSPYSGHVGFGVLAYAMSIFATNGAILDALGKVVAAVARMDDEMNDDEKLQYRRFASRLGISNVEGCLSSDANGLSTHLETLSSNGFGDRGTLLNVLGICLSVSGQDGLVVRKDADEGEVDLDLCELFGGRLVIEDYGVIRGLLSREFDVCELFYDAFMARKKALSGSPPPSPQ